MTAIREQPEFLRIGELATRAGVSVATIKYYIREGLLPPPPVKTGRTMGYYTHAYLERLLLIRKLREEHYLPIRVIRTVLAEKGEKPLTGAESEMLARVGDVVTRRLAPSASQPSTRAEILSRFGLAPGDLEVLEEIGLVGENGTFTQDDVDLLAKMHRAEAEGITRERFPIEGIGHYVELLGELARREVRIFLKSATATVPLAEVGSLAERAVEATEPVLAAIRRKLIVREIRRQTTKEST